MDKVIIDLPARRFPAGFKRQFNGKIGKLVDHRKDLAFLVVDGKLISLFPDCFRRLKSE